MMGYDNVKIENDGYIPSSKTDVNTPKFVVIFMVNM